MEIIKKIRRFMIFQSIFLAVVLIRTLRCRGTIFLIVLCAALEVCALLYLFFKVVKPILKLERTMEECIKEERESGEKLNQAGSDVAFIGQIRTLVNKCATQKTRRKSAAIYDKQAEITALQSQINPHFLYNTLESIRGQALMDDNVEIAKMVEALAAFFRYSISRKGSLVTLRDELANIKNYMMIQRYRFNNRFALEIFIDEEDECAYDYLIPKLIIQPVIENAIFHGLEEKIEGGTVIIEIILTDSNLIITVSDNGKGMDSQSLEILNKRIHDTAYKEEHTREGDSHMGIALPNIHRRIQLLFGEEYGVSVYSTLHQGTDVEITIPEHHERNAK